MTTDQVSGKTAQLRCLIIKAWRERWSAGQFATQIKVVLGRGVSGDVYNLADCLLQQAMTGPAPNQLLLSLLDHCLASQLVSYSATLHAISKFSSFSRPHCTAALLQLILSHVSFISCSLTNRPEECLNLATGLVSVSTWALSTLTQTIKRLVELRDSQVDISNLARVQELLQWLVTDTSTRCLSFTGRLEDTELHQELITTAKTASKQCDQIYVFATDSAQLMDSARTLKQLVDDIKTLDPTDSCPGRGVSGPESHIDLTYSIHSILSFDAILTPTSDLAQLAGHLSAVISIKNVSLSTLVTEMLRCCLLSMNEPDGFEVLKWDAFTLIKLPRLIQMLRGDAGKEEVVEGLKNIMKSSALLNMTDARSKGTHDKGNIFECIVKSMENLLDKSQMMELISTRNKQLELRHAYKLQDPAYTRDISQILQADTTLDSIIRTFENRSCADQNEFDNVISVMSKIIIPSSLDLLLSASAANGTLPALVSNLLMFNEGSKESPGESVKVSQNRAALFDMTFLMLAYISQCFGSEVVLSSSGSCFFSQWARKCLTEPGQVKPLSGWSGSQLAHVGDSLLQQLTTGELRTQVVLWHNVCNSVHLVMKEVLTGLEEECVTSQDLDKLCRDLSNKMCCLPVCVLTWLTSFAHFGYSLKTKISFLDIVDKFLVEHEETLAEADIVPYYQQRRVIMINIIKKIRLELTSQHSKETEAGGGGGSWRGAVHHTSSDSNQDSVLEADMTGVWERTWSRDRLDISDTREVARLVSTGGAEWFVSVLTEKITSLVYNEDVDRATEMVFSLMHVDLISCTLALLLHVLPRYLMGEGKEAVLVHPGGKCLAKLTVDCLAASSSIRSCRPYVSRSEDLETLCNGAQQPVKLRKLNNGEAAAASLVQEFSNKQEQLLEQAHSGLFNMLSTLGLEPVRTPRLEFVCHVLDQTALLPTELSRQILAPAPAALIHQVVKVLPERFSQEMMLRLFDGSSVSGRKNMARMLCLLRNIGANKQLSATV